MNIQSNNAFIKIARRYETILWDKVQFRNICQLSWRIILSLIITSGFVFCSFGIIMIIMGFFGVVIFQHTTILGASVLFGGLALFSVICIKGVGLSIQMLDETSKAHKALHLVYGLWNDNVCKEYTENTKFNPILHNIASSIESCESPIRNRCDYMLRLFLVTFLYVFSAIMVISMILVIVNIFINVPIKDFIAIGVFFYVLCFVFVLLSWLDDVISYFSNRHSYNTHNTGNRRVMREIVDAKKSRFCSTINIVEV